MDKQHLEIAAQEIAWEGDTLREASEDQPQLYKTQSLNAMAYAGEESVVYLENDNIKVGFTTHGGQIDEVLIKKA